MLESPTLRTGNKSGLAANTIQKLDTKAKLDDINIPKVTFTGFKTSGQNSLDNFETGGIASWSPEDLLKRNSKVIPNPIMESRKKDLVLAKKI